MKNEKNLEISNVKTGDAGRFTCRVDGTQEEFTRLVVVSGNHVTPPKAYYFIIM